MRVKNITLAIDADVLNKVRKRAAEKGATVNAIVRDHLGRIAEEQDRLAQARQRIRELAQASQAEVGSLTWTRDDLHGR